MSKRNLKLMSAGVLVALTFGFIGWTVAWATPGSGITATVLAGPVQLDELDIQGDTDTHEVEIKTRGNWECRVMHYRVAPGGFFGWHSHPGPVFAMVKAGTLTFEHADSTSADYPAGTGFVDFGEVHNARNEGNTDVEVVAFFLNPSGDPPRIDEEEPHH